MYIIVVGGGKVGFNVARALLQEGQEVLVIEKELRKVNRINEELGVTAHHGDGCEAATLAEIGAGRADVMIAVTGDDEDNLVSCQVAKYRFKVKRTIARINNPKNDKIFRSLGIDATVSSTNIILDHIEHEVPQHPLVHLMDLSRFGLELVDVTVPDESPAVGRQLGEVVLPADTIVSLVISPGVGPQVARPDLVLGAGDELIAVTRNVHEVSLRRSLTGT